MASRPSIPKIELDETFADIYRRACPSRADKKIGQVLCGVSSAIALSPDFPRNTRYIYQDMPFNTLSHAELSEKNGKLQRDLAIKYLSLIPQRDAFICGKAVAVLFHLGQEACQDDWNQAKRTMDALIEEQQPDLALCPGPDRIPMKKLGLDLLAYKLALDGLIKYPLTVPLGKHWTLNSKLSLAKSELQKPASELLELEGYVPPVLLCCKLCEVGDELYVPDACSGPRGSWINKQICRVLEAIDKKDLPFVFKSQQSFGGAGTYVVKDEAGRRGLLQACGKGGMLRRLFSMVTKRNRDLKPGSILLTDTVAEPVANWGLTFFVRDDGSLEFLAVSEQQISKQHAWRGSAINYAKQAQLKAKFKSFSRRIQLWLSENGYYVPASADVLETAARDGQSSSSCFHLVDLNVRTSGSLCLYMLRKHFTTRRLNCASSFSIAVPATRDQFIDIFRADFESGRVCIVSWYEDKESDRSMGHVVVGGENEAMLNEMMGTIRYVSEEVSF